MMIMTSMGIAIIEKDFAVAIFNRSRTGLKTAIRITVILPLLD